MRNYENVMRRKKNKRIGLKKKQKMTIDVGFKFKSYLIITNGFETSHFNEREFH